MKKYLIFLIPFLFLMAQCHKTPTPEPDLPPATQEGKGTIGCYVNGKPWVPKPYIAIGVPHYLEVVFDETRNNYFGLSAIKDGTFTEYLTINVFNAKIGDNNIVTRNIESFYNSNKGNGCAEFYLDTTKIRTMTITKLDKANKIISGAFELTAINKCKDTLIITKGRFDTTF